MVIKRLAEATRRQDWFTAILEILIVVVGIFIGLQVDDWNQQRLDRKEAAYHLNFMYDELNSEIETAKAELERYQGFLENSFKASMLLTQDAWTEAAEAEFRESIFSLFQFWGPKRRPVSLRRIIDDGKLDLIDEEMQQAILRFESAYIDAIEQTKTSYNYSLVSTPKITASMRFIGPRIIDTVDELLSNETLRGAVRDKAIWQRVQLTVEEDLQEARIELRRALESRRSAGQ